MSRSRRWTMPGRSGSVPPAIRSPSASTRFGPALPGAAWESSPAGLSTIARCSSLQAIARVERAHELGARSASVGALLLRAGPEPEDVDRDQQDHADGDADVGDVERRPAGRIDEVGDEPLAGAIDQVADRPAGEQADRQPEARPLGARQEVHEQPGEGDGRDHDDPGARAVEHPEGDAAVRDPDEVDPGDEVDRLAGRDLGPDDRLARSDRRRRPAAPRRLRGRSRVPGPSPADQADDDRLQDEQRRSARPSGSGRGTDPPAPTEGSLRLRRLRTGSTVSSTKPVTARTGVM